MSYLYSQLWLCLIATLLLGGAIGWFVRGDNRKKLAIIEKRWRKRFTDLEYVNQSLNNQNKQGKIFQARYHQIQSRLSRMNRAAELSSQELKLKNAQLSQLQEQLDQAKTELFDKNSRLDDMVSKLSEVESRHNTSDSQVLINSNKANDTDKIVTSKQIELEKANKEYEKVVQKITRQLEELTTDYKKLENKYTQTVQTNDRYKASLIDAESKLQVTNELLKKCQEEVMNYNKDSDKGDL